MLDVGREAENAQNQVDFLSLSLNDHRKELLDRLVHLPSFEFEHLTQDRAPAAKEILYGLDIRRRCEYRQPCFLRICQEL